MSETVGNFLVKRLSEVVKWILCYPGDGITGILGTLKTGSLFGRGAKSLSRQTEPWRIR